MNSLPAKRSLLEIIREKKEAQQQEAISKAGQAPLAAPAPKAHSASLPAPMPFIAPIKKLSLLERIQQDKHYSVLVAAVEEAKQNKEEAENLKPLESTPALPLESPKETFSLSIVLNKDQLLAKELAFTGKSFVLTGAAGTGKTTAQREIAAELLRQDQLRTHNFRIQGTGLRVDAPSIAFCAYTRIASGNLKRAIHKDPQLEAVLEHNITTVHNLLEYKPETYWNYELNKESFRFVPQRTASNPLDLTHLIIEEATMIGVADLWPKLFAALRPGTQIIFIGDINQLQPVFGASIFNYALAALPVVELTTVYRQKEGSSILDNAHKILKGDASLIEDENFQIIRNGTVQHSAATMARQLMATIPKWEEAGKYDPEQDIFLSPWNKQDLGTDNLNKIIAQHLGDKREAIVHEVICGITKVYLAIGDRVLYNKQVGVITSINRNMDYHGKEPMPASKNLLRFGAYRGKVIEDGDADDPDSFVLAGYENIDLDSMLDEKEEEKKRQASSVVTLLMETDEVISLAAVGDFNPQTFSLGYALTVHKAQGCEWRKVFFIMHKDHSISAHRELLYTAVTRSKEQCILIAKDFMVEKAIKCQKVKGNTIAEKIAYFNAGIVNDGNVQVIK